MAVSPRFRTLLLALTTVSMAGARTRSLFGGVGRNHRTNSKKNNDDRLPGVSSVQSRWEDSMKSHIERDTHESSLASSASSLLEVASYTMRGGALHSSDDDDNKNAYAKNTTEAPVSVKSHTHTSPKSNAVGDPDGEGSSDDDDDDELSDWDDYEDSIEFPPQTMPATLDEVQVNVEYVQDDDDVKNDNSIDSSDSSLTVDGDDDSSDPELSSSSLDSKQHRHHRSSRKKAVAAMRGGLGRRFKPGSKSNSDSHPHTTVSSSSTSSSSLWNDHVRDAWIPHVYLPPPDWTYLDAHARTLDGDGKGRLDRRTLYAGLLLEWMGRSSSSNNSSNSSSPNRPRTYRKFLEDDTSRSLSAALSLATQPVWRQSLSQPNGIRLYDNDEETGCTLAMQETVAMALAHSLGAGLVVLDDNVLSSIRQQLLGHGHADDSVKPAALVQSILALAREGTLSRSSATLSERMRTDLTAGLDDPFDDRATGSCDEMENWEKTWKADDGESESKGKDATVPLVIFLRTQASTSLLKSKSAVDVLLSECNSSESTNLLVLGRGIDATTTTVPPLESELRESEMMEQQQQMQQQMQQQQQNSMHSQNLEGAAPWFGFSSSNQSASGQNDPPGSRRFNIFLARTIDPEGSPGIMGAVAPPEAGNLFPHMMAMQTKLRMEQQDQDSPAKAELERWANMLQQQMQTNGGMPLPPPQFFNASLSMNGDGMAQPNNTPPPTPEMIRETLEQAMTELLDGLAQMNEDESTSPDSTQKAFAQVLRNENLRKGITENLFRAAPALSDPKCQGVLLSVFVPPQHHSSNHQPKYQEKNQSNNMSGWFQKMLNNQEQSDMKKEPTEENRRNSKQKRARTMAAAAAVAVAQDAKENKHENKSDRNLAKLEAVCRAIIAKSPSDPVRAKSWDAWILRERGAIIFRQNRRVLNEALEKHNLSLQEHTGTRGAGSALRQMLSVRIIEHEIDNVIKCAIETEAAKSQRLQESPEVIHDKEKDLKVDVTLSQLLLTDNGMLETEPVGEAVKSKSGKADVQFIHPSSLESALTTVCHISPSPTGGLSVSTIAATHRSKDEISAMAQDKHERALVSQVASPQDIGVTYDMIGGLTEVKELLRQSITYPLKFPHLYSEGIAREAVKGVLLFGPPGTGKTMLAKAVATEGGASFLSVDASSVENKWLGESEKNAKAVFTLARRLAPCVIFIDEVDSLLSSREGSSDDSAHGTLTSVKTTMMSEWDGLNSGTNGSGEAGSDRVVVIGSTNRPFDLDEAVLRRFPRRILVDLPDLETRTEILEVTLSENRLDPAVNLTSIAERLEGYTGSDIKEVCREAVVQISHEQAKLLDQGFSGAREDVTEGSLQRLRPVTDADFESALDKLKRSVSEKGKELARVWEWNDEYGEIKKEKKNYLPHLANMYL